ncbi:MAG: hypothetical protein J2P48_06540 [Alphaproteobacteria bacterium]|nr:hypothetical protein [Alphaproteobacteria bacterium]
MDIYEVELCRRAEVRVVAAEDADEAVYHVTGRRLRSEGASKKIEARVCRLGYGSSPKLYYAD